MVKVFERQTGSQEVTKEVEEEGTKTTVKGVQTSTQVIIASKMLAEEENHEKIACKSSTSRSGNAYFKLGLEPDIIDDKEFGQIIEDHEVLFFDKMGGTYGDKLDATNAERTLTSAKPSDAVIIKAVEQKTVWEDGTEEVVYFGSTILRASSRKMMYKVSDNGPGCACVLGRVVVGEKDKIVSVPLAGWDKEKYKQCIDAGMDKKTAGDKARYTIWVTLEGVNPDDEAFKKDAEGHCAICAFVSGPKQYEETVDEKTNRVMSAKMTPANIFRIA